MVIMVSNFMRVLVYTCILFWDQIDYDECNKFKHFNINYN